jgi:hypothetical protein
MNPRSISEKQFDQNARDCFRMSADESDVLVGKLLGFVAEQLATRSIEISSAIVVWISSIRTPHPSASNNALAMLGLARLSVSA